MDLIHDVILNSMIDEMCFLCYKKSVNTQNIRLKLEVKSELFDETLSLADMIIYLFPSFELSATKACGDCANLIIRMYIKIQRNNILTRIISSIIDCITKKIKNPPSLDSFEDRKLNIKVSLAQIMKKSLKCSQKMDFSNPTDEIYDETVPNKLDENSSQENQCPNCYKLFDSLKKFKAHMRNHNRRQKKQIYYSCNHCNYKSPSKQSLQGHINKKHLKVRPYVCNICYKHYYHRKNLVEHEKTHLHIRNEICEVCGDSFIHKKNLVEHLKLHSGEKPFLCGVCNKRFITSGRRLEHIKRCHREKNECCLLCDKKFSLIKELTRHIKTVHS